MPRETGKSRHRPTYYSQVRRHKRTGPTSLSPLPGSNSGCSPFSGHNWCEDAQTKLCSSNSEHFYGGCTVEEGIPPNWKEIPPNLQKTTMEQRSSTGTSTPLNSPEPAMTSFIVEEEIPPLMKDYCKNFANDKDPRTKWSEEELHRETYIEEQVHPALGSHGPPSSCRLTEDHLVLIFEMQRDLAEMKDYCKNSTDANNEDPGIKRGNCWSKEETHRETYTEDQVHSALGSHDPPSSCRLTEDHLVLIFEMRRDLAEQLQNQHILSKHLDILFNSLSSKPAKSHCPICCQLYAFKIRQDGRPGSPHV